MEFGRKNGLAVEELVHHCFVQAGRLVSGRYCAKFVYCFVQVGLFVSVRYFAKFVYCDFPRFSGKDFCPFRAS